VILDNRILGRDYGKHSSMCMLRRLASVGREPRSRRPEECFPDCHVEDPVVEITTAPRSVDRRQAAEPCFRRSAACGSASWANRPRTCSARAA